jgi:hypothetical protein
MNEMKFFLVFVRKANILAKGCKTHFVINCAAINRKRSNLNSLRDQLLCNQSQAIKPLVNEDEVSITLSSLC